MKIRKYIVTIIVIIGLIIIVRFSMLHITSLNFLNGSSTGAMLIPSIQESYTNKTESVNPIVSDYVTISHGKYETIEETIARIKRDVFVTGTITGISGQETAMFQIEGMPDVLFQINSQLMDGFIVTEITKDHVVLKNQVGEEAFYLKVR